VRVHPEQQVLDHERPPPRRHLERRRPRARRRTAGPVLRERDKVTLAEVAREALMRAASAKRPRAIPSRTRPVVAP